VKPSILVDTGPLVAFLHRRDRYHRWAVEQLNRLEPPLLTCESVLAEACFLLQNLHGGGAAVLDLARTELIRVPLRLEDEMKAVRDLMTRYIQIPMSLADACLVRMSEQHPNSVVMTLDRHFRIYRRHGRQAIPLIKPD
jgi:uncharacterized protein